MIRPAMAPLKPGRVRDRAAALPKPSEVIVVHGRTPFQRNSPVGIPGGSSQSNPCPTTIFTVPSGKILVIDYITVLGSSDAPTAGMFLSITTVAGGISVDYLYALAPAGQNVFGDSMFATTATTQLYADGGSAVGPARAAAPRPAARARTSRSRDT